MSLDNRGSNVRYLECLDGLELFAEELHELSQNNDLDADDRISRIQALQLAIECLRYELDVLRNK